MSQIDLNKNIEDITKTINDIGKKISITSMNIPLQELMTKRQSLKKIIMRGGDISGIPPNPEFNKSI